MNASREQIAALLHEGLTNSAIVRQLRVDKHRVAAIRKAEGLSNVPQQPLTLEQKWASRTRPVAGGHLEWTGPRGAAGTPVMRYREEWYSSAAIAFRIQHGVEPTGYVFAECGRRHCVAPAHVDDEATRKTTREQLRYLRGGRARKDQCRHGHDQAEHGRYEADGTAYCGTCKANDKARNKAAAS